MFWNKWIESMSFTDSLLEMINAIEEGEGETLS